MSMCNTKITIQLLYEMCIHSMDTAITCDIVIVAIILDFLIAYFKDTPTISTIRLSSSALIVIFIYIYGHEHYAS